ncbi:F4 (K88) fimbria major subunit/adhesin FaeG [Escherichia coli]|uniref:F4 (K88) fimbria major subunit/adhesin FaeG n=1 Tax=Escherichia coli TaxID=562 RepID=UPI002988F820|nr:fimbrial protein [Escherichia coli]EKM8929342.1 F4 (K88) fimbria major subunit/adhesin FaeG [Escherichia coli]MDN0705460.1 fimbrial protein [Escherichia coli]HAW0686053.1 F4 (K88) fimbria major subunit/adhesin FaeG [Escherichia coli]HAW7507901.1 F4 (K88) fimbria major subunit/adhesin FaeG [Escherichia coli]
MKKTLIALALAASAVSGMAHAWTSGDFNGTVDIGGSIDATNYRQKWEWEVGTGLNGFYNALSELTNNDTKLTITVTGNKPILLGRTKEAFVTPTVGGWGGIPQIAFTDYKGAPVELKNPDGETNKGLAYFVLPMKNADGTEAGSVRVNASYAGAVVEKTSDSSAKLFSAYAGEVTRIFNGGLPVNVSQSELQSGVAAADRTALFGSLGKADLVAQFQAVIPGATVTDGTSSEHSTMRLLASAAYALGIADGQTIEATFNQAVTTSTQWSAPLNVAITYY